MLRRAVCAARQLRFRQQRVDFVEHNRFKIRRDGEQQLGAVAAALLEAKIVIGTDPTLTKAELGADALAI